MKRKEKKKERKRAEKIHCHQTCMKTNIKGSAWAEENGNRWKLKSTEKNKEC